MAAPRLEAAERERIDHARSVSSAVRQRCHQPIARRVTSQAVVVGGEGRHGRNGRRRPGSAMLGKLEVALVQSDRENHSQAILLMLDHSWSSIQPASERRNRPDAGDLRWSGINRAVSESLLWALD